MREKHDLMCNICKSSPIAYDEYKGELFCLNCGLVFAENYEIFSIKKYERKIKQKETRQRKEMMMSEC